MKKFTKIKERMLTVSVPILDINVWSDSDVNETLNDLKELVGSDIYKQYTKKEYQNVLNLRVVGSEDEIKKAEQAVTNKHWEFLATHGRVVLNERYQKIIDRRYSSLLNMLLGWILPFILGSIFTGIVFLLSR